MAKRTCAICDDAIPDTMNANTKYCTRQCRDHAWYRKRTATPTTFTCSWCGEESQHNQVSGDQRFCSRSCGAKASRPPLKPPRPPRSRIWVINCEMCELPFVARAINAKYCKSPTCRDMVYARQRGVIAERLMGLYRTAFEHAQIHEAQLWRKALTRVLANRDGTDCAICHRTVDLTIPSGPRGSDNGPSIDHIIPWSETQDDSLANLRLTHWACNRKRNTGKHERTQLRLV